MIFLFIPRVIFLCLMKNVMIEVARDGKVSACNSRQVASPLAFWAVYTSCVFNHCLKVVRKYIKD